MDERALQLEVERSRAARLRAWAVLVELRAILTATARELAKPDEKSFDKEGDLRASVAKGAEGQGRGVAGVGHGGALG
jgi:hypothetical protein